MREERREAGLLRAMKGWYRVPFDWLEEWSTGCSDGIVVNSRFTRGVVGRVFPGLRSRVPGVVYPCVEASVDEKDGAKTEEKIWEGKKVLLSINRFEKKKDVGLAVRAFAGLRKEERQGTRLVVAGMLSLREQRAT